MVDQHAQQLFKLHSTHVESEQLSCNTMPACAYSKFAQTTCQSTRRRHRQHIGVYTRSCHCAQLHASQLQTVLEPDVLCLYMLWSPLHMSQNCEVRTVHTENCLPLSSSSHSHSLSAFVTRTHSSCVETAINASASARRSSQSLM